MSAFGVLVEALGFGNGKGHLSFNKMVTFTALWAFVYCLVTKRDPSWALLSFGVIVIGAGFGIKGYLAAVKQNTLAATHTATTTTTADLTEITKAVLANRDHAKGVDPA